MEVTYTLTVNDMWAFHQFHAGKRPLIRLFNGFGTAIVLLVWTLYLWSTLRGLLIWAHLARHSPWVWPLYWQYHHAPLLTFLFLTVCLTYLLWGAKFFFRRRLAGAQALRDPVTMRIGPEGILTRAPTQQNHHAWSDVREVSASGCCVFLYIGPATALIVPKRAFQGMAETAAFEAAARSYQSDPWVRQPAAAVAEVWPPPPVPTTLPVTPEEQVPDPPGTVEITYVTRRADAWRSACYQLARRPAALLTAAVPLLLSALFIASSSHAGPAGFLLAVVVALLITAALVANNVRVQLGARYPTAQAERSCCTRLRPDTFVDINPNGQTQLPWRDVGAVILAGGDLHVHRKDGQGAYFIPRTAFLNPDDTAQFLETMRRYQRDAGTDGLTDPPRRA